MSIDYGMGKTNIDTETGIRYGFIYMNNVSSFAIDDIIQNGTDLSYEAWKEELIDSIVKAIERAIEDYGSVRSYNGDLAEVADSIASEVEYESCGDNQRYEYEDDDVHLETTSDNGIFILKSKYYTLCELCSPCAPGAGYITNEGSYKAYCLPPSWFDEYSKMPYKCFRVDNNEEVFQTE